jgi:pyridoxamine 5'-phosphate oxidase family protein
MLGTSHRTREAVVTLTAVEQDYLAGRQHGRLATVAPNGAPQNKPVGFRYNPDLGTIDISGLSMEKSAKFRNVQVNPEVAFLVDDVTGAGPSGVRFLEIRGQAQTVTLAAPPAPEAGLSAQIIRIHPRRILSWNVEPGQPGLRTRDVAAGA